MSYATDPQRLARLLRDLATALVEAGADPAGSARLLVDEARTAARELEEPPPPRRPGRLICF